VLVAAIEGQSEKRGDGEEARIRKDTDEAPVTSARTAVGKT
jgi:hypothetical protein